jgi:3-isopropylmalate/(R)-2-methylmalate dehydratase small subunit
MNASNQQASGVGVIEGLGFDVPRDNIDTDQIIPASFLTTTGRDSLAEACFHHWRFEDDGSEKAQHPFSGRGDRHRILVAGANFGCGSSREHAPWALLDFGFRAVISTRFADIFRNNALKNGLLPVEVDDTVVDHLRAHPDAELKIDIGGHRLQIDGFGEVEFPLDPFSAYCLVRDIDQMDFLLAQKDAIEAYEHKHERGQGYGHG